MKLITSHQAAKSWIIAIGLLLAGTSLRAQTWDGGGANDDWTTVANWNPNVAPANNGTARINFAGAVRLTPNVNAVQDIFFLNFTNSAGAFIIGGSALTIRSGITNNSSSAIETINTPIIIPAGAAQTWRIGRGLVLGGPTLALGANVTLAPTFPYSARINANISGAGSLILNQSDLYLFGINTYGGSTVINGGYLSASANGALSPNSFVLFGASGGLLELQSGVTARIQGLEDLNGAGRVSVGTGRSLIVVEGGGTFEGVISGGGMLSVEGAGLLLGGSNTFSGTILVTRGVVNNGHLVTLSSERLSDDVSLVVGGDPFRLSFFVLGNSPSASNLVETVGSVTLEDGGVIDNGESIFDGGNGTLVCNTFTMNGDGCYLAVPVVNKGTFTYNSGGIGGRVVNRGTFALGANVNVVHFGNGMANFGTLAVPSGGVLNFHGPGLDNHGSLTLLDFTLAGTGGLTNNNRIQGHGVLGGTAGFVNNAQLTVSGGELHLDNTGANASFGNIDLAVGSQLRLNGGPLNNRGTLNVNSSAVAGTGTLNNSAGGTIVGRGTISCPFANTAGMVLRDSGTLNISQNFSSSGAIQLISPAASLTGGLISNTGSIQGLGNLGNNLANSGDVEAIGGTLLLSGSVTNLANGLMSALSTGKILVSSGLAPNAGIINLASGTFDNNNRPLNNNGQISGYGTFRSGGLANNGSVTLSGGFSTINGNVTNQATRRITVAYNPALFTGTVVNNGTFKVTSTIAQFTGTYIENGAFISDPATNHFTDLLVGDNGYFLGGAGDLFVVGGNFQNGSLQNVVWNTEGAELALRGSASHTFHLAGADRGPGFAGYSTNFAWMTFRLGAGESLLLQDGNATPGAALYARQFILEGGLAQIAAITGNGFKIYYEPTAPGNAYLDGSTYALAGGGSLGPVTLPPIQITSIRLTNAVVRLACTGVPNEAHSVQSSTNLLHWLTIGSATAAPNGDFNFDDTNAPSFTARFYRLSFR